MTMFILHVWSDDELINCRYACDRFDTDVICHDVMMAADAPVPNKHEDVSNNTRPGVLSNRTNIESLSIFELVGCFHCTFQSDMMGIKRYLVIYKGSLYYTSCQSSHWRHNERDVISNHRRPDCLLNHLFRYRLKKTSKLRVTALCKGNPRMTSGFPSQKASNVENISIWWRHYVLLGFE